MGREEKKGDLFIEQNKERYYEVLKLSSEGWHQGKHNHAPKDSSFIEPPLAVPVTVWVGLQPG